MRQVCTQYAVENLQKRRFLLTGVGEKAPQERLRINGIETLGKEREDSPGLTSVFVEFKNTGSHVSHITIRTQIRIPLVFFFFHLGTTEMLPHGELDLGIICCSKLEPQAPSKFIPPGCYD